MTGQVTDRRHLSIGPETVSVVLFDNYSVHSSVTVTIVTRYFFILHNQLCHDGAGLGRGIGFVGEVVCDDDQGSLLVGAALVDPPLPLTYVQKAIKMLLNKQDCLS